MGATFQSITSYLSFPSLSPDSAVIVAGVEFGTPTRDGQCINIGICRVTTDLAMTNRQVSNRRCRFAKAWIVINTESHIKFFFPKANMLPCTERAVFAPGYFPVPLDYVFPADLRAQLPASAPERICAGKYRIQKTAEGYWVEF
jgi:hypothetical protein